MDSSRLGGALICLIALVIAGLFVWGIYLESYWAIAVPVIIGFLSVLALGFWIGWTMAMTKIEAPKPEQESTSEPPSS